MEPRHVTSLLIQQLKATLSDVLFECSQVWGGVPPSLLPLRQACPPGRISRAPGVETSTRSHEAGRLTLYPSCWRPWELFKNAWKEVEKQATLNTRGEGGRKTSSKTQSVTARMEKSFANSHKRRSRLLGNFSATGRGASRVLPSEGIHLHQVLVSSSYSSSQTADLKVTSLVCCHPGGGRACISREHSTVNNRTWCHSLFINAILVFAGNIYPLQLLFF